MASVRQHRGRLLIDYRESGERQRVYTKLADSPTNRAQLERVAAQVDLALSSGANVKAIFEQAGLLAAPAPVAPAPVPPVVAARETIVVGAPTPLFSPFAEQWFGEFKVGWRRTYITTVRGILDQHLLPRFGAMTIGSVTRAQILEFRAHLADVRGRRAGSKLSPARINTIILILRQILQEAADRYEFTMPMGRLKPLKVPKSDVKPFSLEQAQLIIDRVRPDYRQYMTVRFFTGMRSGEIHGLKWKYVDFERRLILVREAFVAGKDEYTKTNSSQREIQMSEVVYLALREQYKATGNQTYVFCTRVGEPLDTANVTKRIWYPLLRHLGLELRRPYQTRHTAATLWLAAGEAPDWIARQMGHTSSEVLFRWYARYVANLTRRDGSAMDRLLSATFKPKAEGDAPAPPAQPPPVRVLTAAAA